MRNLYTSTPARSPVPLPSAAETARRCLREAQSDPGKATALIETDFLAALALCMVCRASDMAVRHRRRLADAA